MSDFFISYTSSDASWAEWVAWNLENSGYTVIIQQWDFSPGSNFVLSMQEAIVNSLSTIAILSEEYLIKAFPAPEWAAAFATDPKGLEKKLIPIRVSNVDPSGLLATVVYIDLYNINDEHQALEKLLNGVSSGRKKPNKAPNFPAINNIKNLSTPNFPKKSEKIEKSTFSSRFICQKISNRQLLDLDKIEYPYGIFSDPTEFIGVEGGALINCVLWIPQMQYIQSSPLQRYTPAVAICFDSDASITRDDKIVINDGLSKLLTLKASKLRNEEKEMLFLELGRVLSQSFIAAITLPEIMLMAGRKDPMVAYSSFFDLLLLPLVQMHRKHNVAKFRLILPKVGEKNGNIVGASKKIMKAIYHEKNGYEVVESGEDGNWPKIGDIARLIAWAVGVAHNQKNDRWLLYLEKGIEDAVFSQSEETASGLTSLS